MRLLIVTQKIDIKDENLGFFYRWVEEFSKYAEEVVVIASLVKGDIFSSAKVRCFSLGKELGNRKWWRIFGYWKLLFKNYREADAALFHMSPEFVMAAAPFILFFRKPSALWYVHKSVTKNLRIAEKLVDYIFTASELSFRLPSKKVIYTGHAIDTDTFRPLNTYNPPPVSLRILTVGRISPVKDVETIIRAGALLKNSWDRQWTLTIIGGPAMPRDEAYLLSLKQLVDESGLHNLVIFEGAHPYTEMPEIYRHHDLFISMSGTGSIDKAVLEAMASGLTVLTSNEAFQSLLPLRYFLEKRSPEFLAERIKALADENRPNGLLRELVAARHSLGETIKRIITTLYSRP